VLFWPPSFNPSAIDMGWFPVLFRLWLVHSCASSFVPGFGVLSQTLGEVVMVFHFVNVTHQSFPKRFPSTAALYVCVNLNFRLPFRTFFFFLHSWSGFLTFFSSVHGKPFGTVSSAPPYVRLEFCVWPGFCFFLCCQT